MRHIDEINEVKKRVFRGIFNNRSENDLAENLVCSWIPEDQLGIEKTISSKIKNILKIINHKWENEFSTNYCTHSTSKENPHCHKNHVKSNVILVFEQCPDVYREIIDAVNKEINEIRLDAVETIYICAVRDKAILTQPRLT